AQPRPRQLPGGRRHPSAGSRPALQPHAGGADRTSAAAGGAYRCAARAPWLRRGRDRSAARRRNRRLGGAPVREIEKPRIVITYCRQCQWLLRAAWMAQELLSTFAEDLGEIALRPGTGGVFRIEHDGAPLWERKRDGGFPSVKALKQLVRD